jgi:DNA invertase Pin-like site-specific DNA recombinase
MQTKIILYVRVSSTDQNTARQVDALKIWARYADPEQIEVVEEKISGAVSVSDRVLGQVLQRDDIKQIVVQSLDRLGRDAIDLLTTIKDLTARGICLTVTDIGQDSILPNGSPNFAFILISQILSSLAEMERLKIKKLQKQGIDIAKKEGKYKGRQQGTTQTDEQFLAKHEDIRQGLLLNDTLRNIAEMTGKSLGTVQKVKKILSQHPEE